MQETLAFPKERPIPYVKYSGEPEFSADRHLDLGQPEKTLSLKDLGYSETQIADCPTGFGVSSAFKSAGLLLPRGGI